ncbi:hypothetical protein I315_03133 [Cryptococcus gattii Ru294]|uniref:Uncharacterized protein n=2 Tax=Cryptococcus gattii TaxID=37769 RepID=E6QYW9_CRYGW|nr:Hypothetical protein CGB_A0165W [Cryptococcus gattii WM276]KIR54078.1 hypothetical protein I315_03133 [Cryptococcus gattii Ru294]KIR80108.1 hypothetical protein I306_02835 [Cryptococcus gattii EJB2]KIY34484.1 hypothetical protein I305_03268 [Cryptococcus gattii E566]KJE05157.1 hypothetical protein I311_00832 [Cryptococcus gattii NT-10]ADV19307.1 Hypothetical protein CGB_A0165W [Cryptococcus gattii WM276]
MSSRPHTFLRLPRILPAPHRQPIVRSLHTSIPRTRPNTATTSHGRIGSTSGYASGSGSGPSQSGSGKKPNRHADWYREIVPAMIPIFVISTTIFLSLSLLRTYLSHSKSLAESETHIALLETQLAQLRLEQKKMRIREKRERERMLPLVVERVLQRVGVVGEDEEEKEEEQPRLL